MADLFRMNRLIRNLLALCIGLLIGGLSVYASAATVPATLNYGPDTAGTNNCGATSSTPPLATVGEWISWFISTYPGGARSGASCGQNSTYYEGEVSHTGTSFVYNYHTCPYGGGACSASTQATRSITNTYVCPADTTGPDSNNLCTIACPAGKHWDTNSNACVLDKCPPGKIMDSGMFQDSDGNGVNKETCLSGCQAFYTGTDVLPIYQFDASHSFSQVYIGKYTASGLTCTAANAGLDPKPTTPTDPTVKPEYNCAAKGQSWGTVNGSVVCVPPGTPSTPPVVQTQPKNTTNPDGTTKQEVQQDKVGSDGTVTRETTTITKDANGNVTSTQTASSSSPINKFCEDNPTASVCKQGSVTGGGDCSAAPSCEGDPVQCAVLNQTWNSRCESERVALAMGKNSTKAAALETTGNAAMTDQPLDRTSLTTTTDLSTAIKTDKFLASCSGLTDLTVQVMGKPFVVPYSKLNFVLNIFGAVMVIGAGIIGFRIVGGA